MNIKQLKRKMRRRAPKTFAKIEKRWDIKIIRPMSDFTRNILKHVNPRLVKLARKNEFIIDGPEIDGELWKLLEKVRRITLLEKNKKK